MTTWCWPWRWRPGWGNTPAAAGTVPSAFPMGGTPASRRPRWASSRSRRPGAGEASSATKPTPEAAAGLWYYGAMSTSARPLPPVIGLDLGQAGEFSALAVLEGTEIASPEDGREPMRQYAV